jgi:cyclic pyranopterin phosphate synthase
VSTPVVLGRRARVESVPDLDGPLSDAWGRVHTDLRVSVTDRCNLRCTYCMPEEGVAWMPRSELLTFDEIERVARVAHELGVRSVRFTGGEPLLRAGLVDLVRRISAIGFDDLAMTTNAMTLTPLAPRLADAGLDRVNVSCDSLDPVRFTEIRRRGELATVLAAMDAAERAGLTPVKVNVVVTAGVNDDEIVDFARFARMTGRVVRFIEYMPLDAQHVWDRHHVVPGEEIVRRIAEVWPLEPASARGDDPAPADRYRFVDGAGEIGIIASVTDAFCGGCNRLRLTADGAIRNCLFAADEWSARDLLRAGGTDDDLASLLRAAVWEKRAGHGVNEPGFVQPERPMSRIGG